MKFDIPAQPAPTAITAFMKQANAQVTYLYDDLKDLRTNAVTGEMEPAAALAKLVDGGDLEITKASERSFALKKIAVKPTTGSIRGNLARETGAPAEGVKVMINETGQQARTDRSGEYMFGSVEPGTYVLVVTAEGYQPLHITDVAVKAGNELTLSKEDMHPADGTLKLEPFVVRAESVTQLEKFEVTGTKEKPFEGTNVDIPRTINDPQAYYIFDSRMIEESGAVDVGDFLKQRLTMNATALSNSQGYNGRDAQSASQTAASLGNTSTVNLRGLGTDNTLILVDGRRMASVTLQTNSGLTAQQPDLNGIPLGAIDRIEVLPSSASGIYGGSAIGGVINVILKKNYTGGEITTTYETPWDTSAPIRTVGFNYGRSFENGKTQLLLSGQYSDAGLMLLQDRVQLVNRGYAKLAQNVPGFVGGTPSDDPGYFVFPPLGATPNIASLAFPVTFDSQGRYVFQNLTLKSTGASLNSPIATLPTGFSATSNPATITGGQWNLSLPQSNNDPSGLHVPIGSAPETKTFMATIRRQMTESLEVSADFYHAKNTSVSYYNPFPTIVQVPATAGSNPFNEDVFVTFPTALLLPYATSSVTDNLTVEAKQKFSKNWTMEADYTWSKNEYDYSYFTYKSPEFIAAVQANTVSVFVDTLANPPDFKPYLVPQTFSGRSTVNDFAIRGTGTLFHLKENPVTTSFGVEYRGEAIPGGTTAQAYDLGGSSTVFSTVNFYKQSQSDASAYGELLIPVTRSLYLQAAARADYYSVSAGTRGSYTRTDGVSGYSGPTLSGQPYHSKAHYDSSNGTIGIRYEPIKGVMIRSSYASAFQPPTYSQLLKNPVPDSFTSRILDPTTGASYDVQTISGGNPDLKPQESKSWTAGVIWEPSLSTLHGLRIDVEYYKIDQSDKIGSLGAQQFVSNEALFPGRVTRDETTKLVTLIDTSLINLTKYNTEGWDITADYQRKTTPGTLEFVAAATIIQHEERQLALDGPLADYVGFVNEGGEAKLKGYVSLSLQNNHWTLGWTTRYFGPYMQDGAVGDPAGTGSGIQGISYVTAQGADHIPSQTYHDFFVKYVFGRKAASADGAGVSHWRLLDGVTLEGGVKNVFNTLPPFDAFYAPYFSSPYGDLRLREVWVSIKKAW